MSPSSPKFCTSATDTSIIAYDPRDQIESDPAAQPEPTVCSAAATAEHGHAIAVAAPSPLRGGGQRTTAAKRIKRGKPPPRRRRAALLPREQPTRRRSTRVAADAAVFSNHARPPPLPTESDLSSPGDHVNSTGPPLKLDVVTASAPPPPTTAGSSSTSSDLAAVPTPLEDSVQAASVSSLLLAEKQLGVHYNLAWTAFGSSPTWPVQLLSLDTVSSASARRKLCAAWTDEESVLVRILGTSRRYQWKRLSSLSPFQEHEHLLTASSSEQQRRVVGQYTFRSSSSSSSSSQLADPTAIAETKQIFKQLCPTHQVGTLTFVKRPGFAWWPAIVKLVSRKQQDSVAYHVQILGGGSRGVLFVVQFVCLSDWHFPMHHVCSGHASK
jgi:hypothetical protein